MSSYRHITTSAFSEGALGDTSDLHRLVYKPCISSNMFSVIIMQMLHTKVDEVQLKISNFKILPADTEYASLILRVEYQKYQFS